MWRLLWYQYTSLFVAILFVPVETLADCLEQYRVGKSSTCWGEPTPERSFALIEISRESLPSMKNHAERYDSPILSILINLERKFADQTLKSVILKFDTSAKSAQDATDCWFYRANGPQEPNWQRKVLSLGGPNCAEDAQLLSVRVGLQYDQEQKEKRRAGATGFDRAFVNLHKEYPGVMKAVTVYADRNYSATAISLAYHGMSVEDVPGAEEFVTEVNYPYYNIAVQQDDTLGAIAQRVTGSASDWPALWAMNTDMLNNPHSLEQGMEIRVPVRFDAKTIPSPDSEVWNVSGGKQPGATVANAVASICGTKKATTCMGHPTTKVFFAGSN